MTVGYIGLGAMGRALAGHLAGRFPLAVMDLNPAAVADFTAKGATTAETYADLARQCEIVILCLPRSSDVKQVLFGTGGLAEGLAPGAIVIDQTSGVPGETQGFAEALVRQGVQMLDAPVAGGVPMAIAGGITIMASGPRAAFDRARPVLEAISPNLFCCSERVGDGQALKLINNMINAANRIATLEIVAAGRRLGLPLALMAETLNGGEGKSFITERLLPSIIENRSSTDFALSLMVKDLNEAATLGMQTGAPLPLSNLARGVIQTGLNILGPSARLDDVVPFMETLTATRFREDSPPMAAAETLSAQHAMDLVVTAVAACTRLIAYENTAMGVKFGLEVDGMAPVINSGSGRSAQSLAILPVLARNGATTTTTLSDLVGDLTELVALGAAAGVPMLMTNAVRNACEARANAFGRDLTLDAMATSAAAAAGAAFGRESPPIVQYA